MIYFETSLVKKYIFWNSSATTQVQSFLINFDMNLSFLE